MARIDYSKAKEWIVSEKDFDSEYLGKCEAIMCQGNGYLGLRNATEEVYVGEQRNLFVAGTFNKSAENDVTELPNAADITAVRIRVNGQLFSLTSGKFENYDRSLNIKTGQTVRSFRWTSPAGDVVDFEFCRFVSMKRLHVIGQKITVKPVKNDVKLHIVSGINGQMANSGAPHFTEGDKRLFGGNVMQYTQTTTQSDITFFLNTELKFKLDGKNTDVSKFISMDRRIIRQEYDVEVSEGSELCFEKISTVHTTRDKGCENKSFEDMQRISLEECSSASAMGYDVLFAESAEAWNEKVWNNVAVEIDSTNERDQLAVRFAQYHLYVMTPAHDNRMNIGAKGLSGEAYKGHTFWDTEIFMLPFFTFSDPKIARSLEEYRYLTLEGAHKKAKGDGYEGAEFPWESAWLADGEVTPVWGAADIITGLPTKIWSGFIETHITADVAFGIWQYYMVTGDQDFMDKYGYELLIDTAIFWASRLQFSETDKMYHINDVIGPDEYKEHIDDNAFTNYMAHWNIGKAIEYYGILKADKPEIFDTLNKKFDLEKQVKVWQEKMPLIFLPKANKNNVIPQNKTFLDLKDIDLSKYKAQENVGTIFRDYNLEQINGIQVSKQADLLLLMLLMEDMFTPEEKAANWDYYEKRTLHDSSLSLSTHCILANDMKNYNLSYKLFQEACSIDMGENMRTSDAGIHGASFGGIWQGTVFGFGGVRMLGGKLRINPALPENWSCLSFSIWWHGQKLSVKQSHTEMSITNVTATSPVTLTVNGKEYTVDNTITVTL